MKRKVKYVHESIEIGERRGRSNRRRDAMTVHKYMVGRVYIFPTGKEIVDASSRAVFHHHGGIGSQHARQKADFSLKSDFFDPDLLKPISLHSHQISP